MTIFMPGDTATYTGPAIGRGDSLIMRGDTVAVTEGNEDEDDGVTVILAELGDRAVPAFAQPADLVWVSGR